MLSYIVFRAINELPHGPYLVPWRSGCHVWRSQASKVWGFDREDDLGFFGGDEHLDFLVIDGLLGVDHFCGLERYCLTSQYLCRR